MRRFLACVPLVAGCASGVGSATPEPPTYLALGDTCAGSTGCILAGVVGTLTAYDKNMQYILGELRKVYDGPLVTLGIYNPYPGDTTAEWGIGKLNATLAAQAQSHGAMFVDGAAA